MNHHIANIQNRIAHDMKRVLQGNALNSTKVIAYWRESTSVSPVNPLLVSEQVAANWQEVSREFTALVHYVNHSASTYVAHKEVATGDVILDFDEDTPFETKKEIRFLIDGSYYVPKKVGKALRDSWDVHGSARTLLLMPQV